MGTRGPVPKRSEERRRTNKPTDADPVTAPAGTAVLWPEPEIEWHDLASDWYMSLQDSGQAVFYQQSDVMVARYLAEAMSRNLLAGRFSAQLFAAVMAGMTELLATEGSRRRVRVELERAKPESNSPAGVTALDDYRASITG